MTLECALAGLPTVIGYRVSAVTAFIARCFIKVKWLGMPNLLEGKEIMPELMQENCTAVNLEQAVLKYLNDPALVQSTRSTLTSVRRHLGTPGSADRAAQELLPLI